MSVGSLVRDVHNLFRRHLSDDDLTLLLSNELPSAKRLRAEPHLGACERCRTRQESFEYAASQVMAYQNLCTQSDEPRQHRQQRDRLIARLERLSHDESYATEPLGKKSSFEWPLPHMNPILATGLILAMVSVICVFVWMQQSRPTVTSNALLVRAEVWDPAVLHHKSPGVIRQTVKITTQKRTLRRTIYRDAQGKRESHKVNLAPQDELLKNRLAEADVPWNAPLSATSYQDWHDAQRVREDRIRRAAGDLLVLTTTTPDGTVAAESLTVRDTDFHPVRRTVSFRDSETVEIAEVDYSVLPWSPPTSSLFQPEGEVLAGGVPIPQPVLIPLPPRPLTDSELDDAELSARLTLDRLHADTGEQIEVVRGPQGIEVRGITNTAERKHELEAQLDMLPHVTASISSIEELKAKPLQQDELSSVKLVEVQTQTTPLEVYYLAHGRGLAPLNKLAPQLLNDADAIALESKAIVDLQQGFASDEDISTVASATLSDLLFTHKHRLLAALADEEQLLTGAQIEAPHSQQPGSADVTNLDLSALAERNLALTRELALGKSGNGRPAETIAAELAASTNELSVRARAVQVISQDSTKLNKRK